MTARRWSDSEGSDAHFKMHSAVRPSGGRNQMPATYDKMGIRFQYPDNWSLDEDDAMSGGDTVSVYSPGCAFWSVAVHPTTSSPDRLVEAAVDVMREEYTDLEYHRVNEAVGNVDLVGFDMNFFYLDLSNTAQVRSCRTPDATYVFMYQAEDREFADIEPVFRAITQSLFM